eukprot:TRINITY_DN91259_c0_g1_i1.p1 TRINITY_DN91259_c0_g1~~TRINITY_DN91259_c0_g1_i1.p1  ORF type:complete len:522 (-),score=106.17 TRINITY_DN91259_c0_g1_i1:25-1410(-)
MGDTPAGVVPGSEADTSHILGFLRRTVRLLELGIKPIFIFDGEAPEMKKSHVLTQREKLRAKSREQLEEAKATGDDEAIKRHSARLVKTTQRHNDEVMELLRFMGVPALQAPGEAECFCAALASAGCADAAATEDMDALVFGAPRLLRNLHRAAAQHQIPLVQDIRLELVLGALSFSQAEFVDFCILAGCDYLATISKVGIMTAQQLIKKHRTIEVILEKLDRSKHTVPEEWNFQAARKCFQTPDLETLQTLQLKACLPDAAGLRSLLLERYALQPEIVSDCITRLLAVKGCPGQQQRALKMPPCLPSAKRGPDVQQVQGGALHSLHSENSTNSLVAQSSQSMPIVDELVHPSSATSGGASAALRQSQGQRPMPTPARSSARSNAAPAKPLPRGQQTIAGIFASKRPRPSEETSPQKRRRQKAVSVLQGTLGADVVISLDTPLEELECLAADLAAVNSGTT